MGTAEGSQAGTFRDPAFSGNRDAPVHRWVPWTAGFSKHFIEDALETHAKGDWGTVLDPFAGVGTALVEADLAGHDAVGFEINPYAAFVAQVKLEAHLLPIAALRSAIEDLHNQALTVEQNGARPISVPPQRFQTRSPFYSPKVERKVLLMMDFIHRQPDARVAAALRLAFGATMVEYSNYSYEPSLGRRRSVGRADVEDHPVAERVARKLTEITNDAEWYRTHRVCERRTPGRIHLESFFDGYKRLNQHSVDLIVTSPPYANNYHYNRNTRPHLYWLGFCEEPGDLKYLEGQNFGTYWQRARALEEVTLHPSIDDPSIAATLAEIRRQNPERGLYGGSGWANYVATYLNDCIRFVDGMKWCLRSNATALVVIGNSIVQGVHVPTDRFFAKIAQRQGLEVMAIHTPRLARVGDSITNSSVRRGEAGGQRLYESVVELRQP